MNEYQKWAYRTLNDDLLAALSAKAWPEGERDFVAFVLRWKLGHPENPPRLWPTGGAAIRPNESAQLMLAAFNSGHSAEMQREERHLEQALHAASNIQTNAMALERRRSRPVASPKRVAGLGR